MSDVNKEMSVSVAEVEASSPVVEVVGAPAPAKPRSRWVVMGEVVLMSPARIRLGAESGDGIAVHRHNGSGQTILSGTSLAGALRSHLAAVIAAEGGAESGSTLLDGSVELLFGSATGSGRGESPRIGSLTVYDSHAAIAVGGGGQFGGELRVGARRHGDSGTNAKEGGWSTEAIAAGTVFPVRIELEVPELSEGGDAAARHEDWLLSLLATALAGLDSGIRVGSRRSRGLGAIQSRNWRARRFGLSDAAGWNSWLTSDHLDPFAGTDVVPSSSSLEAIRKAGAGAFTHPISDARRRVLIELSLNVATTMLIRGAEAEPSAPDVAHAHVGGSPVLPATSLAGALRARALVIARLLRAETGDAEAWVARVFGHGGRSAGGTRRHEAIQAARGLVTVSDGWIEASRAERPGRGELDRFTASLRESSLSTVQAISGGRTTVRIEMQSGEGPELGLFLLALKDLLAGELPLGSGAAVGRGMVRGRAALTFHEPLTAVQEEEAPTVVGEATDTSDEGADAAKPKRKRRPSRRSQLPRAQIEPGKSPTGDAAPRINESIRMFRHADAIVTVASQMESGDDSSDDAPQASDDLSSDSDQ